MEADSSPASSADSSTSPGHGKLTKAEREEIRAASVRRWRATVAALEQTASRQWDHVHRVREQLEIAEAFLDGTGRELVRAREALAVAEGKAKPKLDFGGEDHPPCAWCGTEMVRKVSPSGSPESASNFHGRRFCSPSCGRHGVAEEKRNAREQGGAA